MQRNGDSAPIRVVVDAMGGDYGPPETVPGALAALEEHDAEVILVGDREPVERELPATTSLGKPLP